jgi:hypothetical protein
MAGRAITFDTVRKIGLALPDVEEGTAYGTPALKIRGELLTCMAINKSAEPGSLALRIDFDRRDELVAADPETYYLTDHYVDYPVVLVRLSRIHPDALRDLLGAAWRFVSAQPRARRRPRSSARRADAIAGRPRAMKRKKA